MAQPGLACKDTHIKLSHCNGNPYKEFFFFTDDGAFFLPPQKKKRCRSGLFAFGSVYRPMQSDYERRNPVKKDQFPEFDFSLPPRGGWSFGVWVEWYLNDAYFNREPEIWPWLGQEILKRILPNEKDRADMQCLLRRLHTMWLRVKDIEEGSPERSTREALFERRRKEFFDMIRAQAVLHGESSSGPNLAN